MHSLARAAVTSSKLAVNMSTVGNYAIQLLRSRFWHESAKGGRSTEGGGVYTFGKGEYGQLGHGDEENQLAPRRVPAAGFNGERVVMVAAGGRHTVALSEAGHVFTWGNGEDGQLGHGDEENQRAPRQVEAGRFGGEKVVFVAAGAALGLRATALCARLRVGGNSSNGAGVQKCVDRG